MKVEFFQNMPIPTSLMVRVDNKYDLTYTAESSGKAFTFILPFKGKPISLDTIKDIMMSLASSIAKQYDGALDFTDFQIMEMLTDNCKFKLIFSKPETR